MATKIGNITTGGPSGATGPAGPTGATGATGPSPTAALTVWNSATTYTANAVVLYSAGFYQALSSTTNNQPDTDTTHWSALGYLSATP